MKKPLSGLLKEEDLFLFIDYYELTSGKCNHDHGMNKTITENYFFRRIPDTFGSYILTVGLEQLINYIDILNNGLSIANRDWLKRASDKDLDESFLNYLHNFKFKGDVYAIPEGTPVFPNEPIINISGPSIDVQIFETYLLNMINFQSLVATKTSRMHYAAKGHDVFFSPNRKGVEIIDFGARRAHGRDAALLGARAAYIGGASGTSLVIAGMKWGIPYFGTMPHKFIQERYQGRGTFKDAELKAFRHYAKSFPHNTMTLPDTYETIRGVKNSIIIGKELNEKGYELQGTRLDSGDLVKLSKQSRKILDEAGLTKTKIFASDSLDEFMIEYLVSHSAPIDGFGVGTRLITGANYNPLIKEGGPSALNGTYKLAENTDETDCPLPSMKFTDNDEKSTLPGRNQTWRRYNNNKFSKDIISLWDETVDDAKPLMIPIILNGNIVYDFPETKTIREYSIAQLSQLPIKYRVLQNNPTYPVVISDRLQHLRDDLFSKYQNEYIE